MRLEEVNLKTFAVTPGFVVMMMVIGVEMVVYRGKDGGIWGWRWWYIGWNDGEVVEFKMAL